MRVLIATSPGLGHIYPAVSLAWALRAAGHDVILATGGHHELASQAGLQVVDAAPGVDFAKVFGGFMARSDRPDQGESAGLDLVAALFAEVSAKFTDGIVELARGWRPELVVHTVLQGAGPLAARVINVPSVVHTIGIGQPPAMWQLLATQLAGEYERFGVTPTESAAVLDVTPPSMREPSADGWSMRYVPYNGGAVLPTWLLAPRQRRRVTVTLGSVLPQLGTMGTLARFVASAGAVDAEFVVTLGGADRAALGDVPDNVRLVDWVPLGPLLAASDAVVHHGGAGTTLTALDAGLPQLVVPHMADQPNNAAAVAKSGAGAMLRPEELDVDRVVELLADEPMRDAAEGIAADMATQPTPAELVSRIIALAS